MTIDRDSWVIPDPEVEACLEGVTIFEDGAPDLATARAAFVRNGLVWIGCPYVGVVVLVGSIELVAMAALVGVPLNTVLGSIEQLEGYT